MDHLKFRTKLNSSPEGKPRVYFTCHPDDFTLSFNKICGDIFKTHDCTIYYTEDMSVELTGDEITLDLGRMNLFVIPVTFRLLHTRSRTMDIDFPYAKEKLIPVLPIMMEPGLDPFYQQKNRFGDLQYLDPYAEDATAIRYEEKLERYLNSVLIGDAAAKRVRAAFDAYFFLSYRKKDRKHANELMRLIHSAPSCRDVAIWYDEFLTPGESFTDSIRFALEKSSLFTLLVTPNLINEPNYVQAKEYPAALNSGKMILPTEMETTNLAELKKQFQGIPDCVDAYNGEAFRSRLLESVKSLGLGTNSEDPAHNYLIGLAYLDGIDMEVDRTRALELITSAADAGFPDAMEALSNMYRSGHGVSRDYLCALYWSEKLCNHYAENDGENSAKALEALESVANAQLECGSYKDALSTYQRIYRSRCETQGQNTALAINDLRSIARLYGCLGDQDKQGEMLEAAFDLGEKELGKKHPQTISALIDSLTFQIKIGVETGRLSPARECKGLEDALSLSRLSFGEGHPYTVSLLNSLSRAYCRKGEMKKATGLAEKAYGIICNSKGEDDLASIHALISLADAYSQAGNSEKAINLAQKARRLHDLVVPEVFDVDHTEKLHPTIIQILNLEAYQYFKTANYRKSFDYYAIIYRAQVDYLGENHLETITTIYNLAATYYMLGDRKHAAEYYDKAYHLRSQQLGSLHRQTLQAIAGLAYAYAGLGERTKSLALMEDVYHYQHELLYEGHPDTLATMEKLINAYWNMGHTQKAIALAEETYNLRCKLHGKGHPNTITALNTLNMMRQRSENNPNIDSGN